MKLSDRFIREFMDGSAGALSIVPFRESTTDLRPPTADGYADGLSVGLTSAGYDFTLSDQFLVPIRLPWWRRLLGHRILMDPTKDLSAYFRPVTADTLAIRPGDTVLGCTVETFQMPANVNGVVVGRSSYARAGLNLNCTPIEPGWRGRITLELSNTSQHWVVVKANAGIGQLQFELLTCRSDRDYDVKAGRYQDQTRPTLPIPRKHRACV